jgi:hypothetical protein
MIKIPKKQGGVDWSLQENLSLSLRQTLSGHLNSRLSALGADETKGSGQVDRIQGIVPLPVQIDRILWGLTRK